MKIIIKDRNGDTKRIYQHSQELLISKTKGIVSFFDVDGKVSEAFEYVGYSDLNMVEIPTTGNLEIIVTIIVGELLYDTVNSTVMTPRGRKNSTGLCRNCRNEEADN